MESGKPAARRVYQRPTGMAGFARTVGPRDDFNRPLIFALVSSYYEPWTWLFGGVFKVLARHEDRYEVEQSKIGVGFIGRLKLRSPYNSRLVTVKMEDQYEKFEVVEILRQPYTGRPFPGYTDIDRSFEEIETIVSCNQQTSDQCPLIQIFL